MKPLDPVEDGGGASEHSAFARFDARIDHHPDDATAAIPDSALLFSGAYHQSGYDLVITRAFETVTVHDYFRYDFKPALVAPDGSELSGAVVTALTEGRPATQIVGDAQPARVTAIGRVETVTGAATVVRNGQTVALHAGDLVYKGDAVETGAQGSLAITFIDGTAFTLAEDARMVLNEMIYQPGGSNNSSLLSLVQGSITFVAGEVAHTGEMKVDTPVATMGIRGTAVHVNISAHNGPTRFSVMREPNGRVGSYILYDHKSGAALATVADAGNVVELQLSNGQIVINTVQKSALDFQQEQDLTHQVFQAYQAGQQDSLLRALTQTHDPNGGSHGSSGPPQTGPSGGQVGVPAPADTQPEPPTTNPVNPQLNLQPQTQPQPDAPPLPILFINPHTAPTETVIVAKNATFNSPSQIQGETVISVQAGNGPATPVSAAGTTVSGLYGDFTIAQDGTFSYTADHAAALGAGTLGIDTFSFTETSPSGQTTTVPLAFDVVGASNDPIVTGPISTGAISERAAVQTINLLSGATNPNPNEAVTVATDSAGHPAVQVSTVSGPVAANAVAFSVDPNGHLTIDPSQFSSLGPTQSETLRFSYTLVDASGGATPQTATVTIDGAPAITLSNHAQTIGAGHAATISGIVYSEIGTVAGETFSAAVTDTYGHLSVSGSGGTVTGSGTPSLTITGVTLSELNAYLASLTDTEATPTSDTIALNVSNSLGITASQQTIAITVNDNPVIAVSGPQTIDAGQSASISGVSVAETGDTSGEAFSATLSDTYGHLSVSGSGGTVTGSGTTSLSITGVTLSQLNMYLASLSDTDSTPGPDTITLHASDSFGNAAAQQTIAITVNGVTGNGGWIGDTLKYVYYYPSSNTTYFTPPTFSVPSTGTEGNPDGGGVFYLSVSSTSITASDFQFSSYWTQAAFNGFQITDLSGNPEISGVTIDAASNMAGLTLADISFTSNTVTVNWEGLGFNTNTIVKLDLTFDPPLDPSQVTVAQTLDGSVAPVSNMETLVVSDETELALAGTINNAGTINVSGSNAPAAIGIEGNVTLAGGGHINLSESNENYVIGTGTLTNIDNVISGGGDVGNGTLTIHNAGVIEADGPYALIIDTGTHALVNTGTLEANNGTLIVDSPVTGGGHAIVSGGTIEFSSASDTHVIFDNGTTGTLALDQPEQFTGTISGFANQDKIDLGDVGFTASSSLSYLPNANGTGGTLSVSDGVHVASIAMLGAYFSTNFAAASDGHGGTLISAVPGETVSAASDSSASSLRPSIIGLTASADTDHHGGDTVTLSGEIAGTNGPATIAWDGSSPAALVPAEGIFSASQDLSAGDHVATLAVTDSATHTQTAQTIDIDIGGSDAPFMFAPATGPAVLIGSQSPSVSQTMTGSSFADTIVAGAGNDTLTGHAATGGDTFVFKTAMGNDQITDLHTGAGGTPHDVIDVSAFHFANYQALLAAATPDANGDAAIALGTHTLTLDHVQKADLQPDLFHL